MIKLTQSEERGANNGRVLCSRLTRTRSHFLYVLLSLFKKFAYIRCIKNCIESFASSVGRARY